MRMRMKMYLLEQWRRMKRGFIILMAVLFWGIYGGRVRPILKGLASISSKTKK
jgi:hypothetical protein